MDALHDGHVSWIFCFRVVLEKGGRSPGCVTQGSTRAEALDNIREAITAYLDSLKAHDEPIPPSVDVFRFS